jgi:hypothetical protein
MSVGVAILNLLGLAPQFQEAEMIISGTQTAVSALKIVANLFSTEQGEKAKEELASLIAGSKQKPDGSIHLDTAPVQKELPVGGHSPLVWAWVGGLQGYVCMPRAQAEKEGLSIWES